MGLPGKAENDDRLFRAPQGRPSVHCPSVTLLGCHLPIGPS